MRQLSFFCTVALRHFMPAIHSATTGCFELGLMLLAGVRCQMQSLDDRAVAPSISGKVPGIVEARALEGDPSG